MRIGCLQFAPQVGDIDNNLNRADAVLNRANPEDLDLLVLPELAFTGYNFKSLQEISPFLEPKGSGISALWARTVALKLNCIVTVGYPEKVDVKPKWPTSPEYYNSVIVVNRDGETIANYRKSFLYYTDETWALEGQDGFYADFVPGLGTTSMGICMDLKLSWFLRRFGRIFILTASSPYKFEAPWHAFEFAFHCLDVEANVVILTMAWLTREDARLFSRMPNEPDMDTLTYWISRLEPLIRSENGEEVIIIFCNRTGIETDAVYAGTSAVIGVKDGEVNVYGMLGRGEKNLLVVDTAEPPRAKLVYRPDDVASTATPVRGSEPETQGTGQIDSNTATHENPPPAQSSSKNISEETTKTRPAQYGADGSVPSIRRHTSSKASHNPAYSEGSSRLPSPKEKHVSQSHTYQGGPSRREKARAPPIKIPSRSVESDTIPTPSGPSPTPLSLRPNFDFPSNGHDQPVTHPVFTSQSPAQPGNQNAIRQQDKIAVPTLTYGYVASQLPNRTLASPRDTLPVSSWRLPRPDSPTLSLNLPAASQAYTEAAAAVEA
ncbi:carbon-nitrogen hydrolase [Xylaria palmicola]|nr:carbon-nitrogen hydrolase [Xylaria palmicola]